MKRAVLWAAAAAAIGMWMALLMDGRRATRSTGKEQVEPRASAPVEVAAPAPSSGVLQKLSANARRVLSPAPKAPRAPAPAAAPDPESEGELGDGAHSPLYAELERNYANESRNGDWALPEEQRLRGLLRGRPIAKQLALLNCQDTVCKIVLDGVSREAVSELLNVPGLREEARLDARSPYSLRGGQLTLFFRPPAGTQTNEITPP